MTSGALPEIRFQWGVRIPTRDGAELAGNLYLPPEGTPPAPAVFLFTPYVAQTYHETALYFAGAGYPFLAVDIRGRGNSPGEFRPSKTERKDGYDAIEWLAAQPYCDGRVTSWGGSFSGYTQWMTAAEGAPSLATIVPAASPYRGLDSPARNNVVGMDRISWLTLVAGHTSQDKMFWNQQGFWGGQFRRFAESGLPFREAARFLGIPTETFEEWVEQQEDGPQWDALNPTAEEYARLTLPILTITGHYDGDQPGALEHYKRHMAHGNSDAVAKHHLVIGPWNHAGTRTPVAAFDGLRVGPAALVDLRALHVDWYRWTMQGGPRPGFLPKRVAYYVMGAEEWRYADTLDDVTAGTRELFLASRGNPTDVFSSGSLVETPEAGGPDSYVDDPRDLGTTALEATVDPDDMTDQRMLHARRGKLLVYHSAPFAEDLEIAGFFGATLWIAIDQPDTDFRVSVHEVALDGSSQQLSHDVLRARYRESFREARLVETTEPLPYEFHRFWFVARRIPAGHRLRLVVEPISSIYAQRNRNTGGSVVDETLDDARTVTVRLFHDPDHPSALRIPLAAPPPVE
jgi:putative CocE/NonD family hydrolase